MFPLLLPTIAVVATTIIITALKTFDIVYIDDQRQLRHPRHGANSMIKQLFNNGNSGRASAIAVILLLAIVPVMVVNIRRFRAQEAIR